MGLMRSFQRALTRREEEYPRRLFREISRLYFRRGINWSAASQIETFRGLSVERKARMVEMAEKILLECQEEERGREIHSEGDQTPRRPSSCDRTEGDDQKRNDQGVGLGKGR